MNTITSSWKRIQSTTTLLNLTPAAALTTLLLPVVLFLVVRRTMAHDTEAEHREKYDLEYFKRLYRRRRDEFRASEVARGELREWKGGNDGFGYCVLAHGLIPRGLIGKPLAAGTEPYSNSDTFFSDYEVHNIESKILHRTADSYIIGNNETYDKRQYPPWLDEKYASKTPEGQGFGHSFVIPRKRIFNIVDPEATANDCALLKEMKAHFVAYWSNPAHRKELLHSVKGLFDKQNLKLTEKDQAEYEATSPPVLEDYDDMAKKFLKLEADDFIYAFHPHPDHSVGHLHMHVFPKDEELRRVSSKEHDKKTIPLEAVLEVEAEDKANKSSAHSP